MSTKLELWLERVDKDTSLDGTFYWQAISVIEKLKEALESIEGSVPFTTVTDMKDICTETLAIDPEKI